VWVEEVERVGVRVGEVEGVEDCEPVGRALGVTPAAPG